MISLRPADTGECDMSDSLELETNEIREEVQRLETETREAEQETKARAALLEVTQDLVDKHDVLVAAGTLVSVAQKSLSSLPAKSDDAVKLRHIVASATEIVNVMSEVIRRTLIVGNAEPPPEKDRKAAK